MPNRCDGGHVAIEEITVEELAQRLEAGVVLLDVREPAELAEARVPGVLHIPLAQVPSRMSEVPEGDLAVICRSGARSMQACQQFAAAGREAVNVAGGILAWIDSGRPTESD